MIYLGVALGIYLIIGIILTRTLLLFPEAPSIRMRFRDAVLGALFMPVITLALLLSIWFEKLWKRLLLALDYEPEER